MMRQERPPTTQTSDPRDREPRVALLAERTARWAATRPRRVLIGAALVVLLSLVSLSQLRVTSSLTAMLGTGSATAAAMERVTTGYRSGDALLLLVEHPPDRDASDAGRAELVDYAERLEAGLRADPATAALVKSVRFREDPDLRRFASEVMLPHAAFYLGPDEAAELALRLHPERMRAQFARNEAMIGAPGPAGGALSRQVLRDPLRLFELAPPGLLPQEGGPVAPAGGDGASRSAPDFSTDGRALLVHVGALGLGSDYAAAGRLVEEVVRVARALNAGDLRIEPAGAAAIAHESSSTIRRDAVISTVVSVALLYGLFLLFYRRWTAGLVIGGVAAVGMIAGIGVAALAVREVSPLAAMIAALLAGLGTDYGIHFRSHYDAQRARGCSSAEASAQTARRMAVPIGTNCVTTIFGFVSLWPSGIRMLSDFAVLGAAGLAGALVSVFILTPAALALLDRRPGPGPAARAGYDRLADAIASRPRRCMGSSLALLGFVTAAAWVQGFSLDFEPDLTVMHPRPSRALDATGEVIRRFSSRGDFIPVEVLAPTPEALVVAVHDFAAALGSPACRAVGVTGVIGLHALVPDPRASATRTQLLRTIDPDRAVADFDAAVAASAFEPAAYAEYRDVLRELVSARSPPTIDAILRYPGLAAELFPDATLATGERPLGTVMAVRLASPLQDRVQRRAAIAALNAAASTVPGGGVTVAGIAAVSEDLEAMARDGLPRSIAISLVLVLAWLTVVFRRPLDVLLAMVPLIFGAGTTVLFIIAIGERFNPINSVAIPLLDGIAVDAGVFLVSAYRAHASRRAELLDHLRSTAHAVLLSVSTTATAFAALLFTHTPAVRSLGLVSAVGIVASGVGALLLLMPILIRRAPDRPAPDPAEPGPPNPPTPSPHAAAREA